MLAILTTHPIQYQIPLWQALSKTDCIPFEVWYLTDHGTRQSYDVQFGQSFAWDIDTLAGYPHCFLPVTNRTQVNNFGQLRLNSSIGHLFKEKHIEALWIQGWQVMAYWQAVWYAYQQGIPVWLRGESNDLSNSRWPKSAVKRLLLKQFFNRISYFLYIGSANRRLYQQFGVPEQKLVSAPYGVDNQRFAQASQKLAGERTTIRQKWNVPENAFCFLFCGKLISKKRPFDLLEAFERIIAENPLLGIEERIHLLIVGSGELRELLHTKAQQLELNYGRSLVTFVGFLNQTEIPEAYVAADCLVLPSDAGETWGLVVNEAMACGCPAIVSNLCGCAEDLIQPLGETYVYPCGDVTELAHRLQRVALGEIEMPSRAKLDAVLQKHSMQTVIANIGIIYQLVQDNKQD